jgi:hypothetical protein
VKIQKIQAFVLLLLLKGSAVLLLARTGWGKSLSWGKSLIPRGLRYATLKDSALYGPQIQGGDNALKIAEAVIDVVRTYGLTSDQIGWFVLYNATSNDTCVAQILTALDINDEVEHRRLRCLGHIINLVAKSFFGANSDIFEKEIDRAQLEEEQVERNLWRK